ncbi:hypothetical protein [Microbacterium sp. No. 7]|uniref:hypothetical protein n=1 Tax=Microbacterium sp. No. 7 TaxID=1714373 RepID=UPI0006CF9BD2|nr:hypothetical protein [Microbacterium sp. No. 7]ALJ22049.1 hypothetical protein AOA12_20000 [Microbacterium sp. No. 7]
MRKRIPPFIVLNGTGTEGGGIVANPDEYLPGDADLNDTDFKAKRGFPRGTKKDDMEPAEREAYWRYEAKKQQHRADTVARENGEWAKLGSRDDVAATLAQQEQARRSNLDDAQKAIEDARTEGKQAGQAEARTKYLTPAIEGQIVGLTRASGETPNDAVERVRGALKFVDVTKFLDDKGDLDAEAIQTFAQSIAPVGGNDSDQGGDPLYQSLGREQMPAPGSAGSVGQYRKQAYERRTANK